MALHRVVVTGIGAVSPLGASARASWEALIGHGCGVVRLSDPAFSSLPCRIAAPADHADSGGPLPRFIEMALVAAREALDDAGWHPRDPRDLQATGVSIGSGMSNLDEIVRQHEVFRTRGYRRVSPHFVPRILGNMAAGHVSIAHGFCGPNLSAMTACASGAHAVGDAFRVVGRGDATVMVAGASEAAITPLGLAGFCQARAVCTSCNDRPREASRPFDRARDGFVVGEGAAIMVLEEMGHAVGRGARIYAEVRGYGCSADAHHITASHPEGHGACLAMQRALADGRVAAGDVDHVNAHATSTKTGREAVWAR